MPLFATEPRVGTRKVAILCAKHVTDIANIAAIPTQHSEVLANGAADHCSVAAHAREWEATVSFKLCTRVSGLVARWVGTYGCLGITNEPAATGASTRHSLPASPLPVHTRSRQTPSRHSSPASHELPSGLSAVQKPHSEVPLSSGIGRPRTHRLCRSFRWECGV